MARRIVILLLALSLCVTLTACSKSESAKEPQMAYLYGETHGNPDIMDLELELWQDYYHNQGMRHLFLEHAYFTSAFLNLWMQAEDDTILLELYEDWEGTTLQFDYTLEHFRAIKQTCPETVFHGTDVGHQYWNTGKRYLAYLEENGMTDSVEYQRTLEAIEQGKGYYCNGLGSSTRDDIYRENTMAANFTRELEALDGESIMGIYGMAHVKLDSLNHTNECDSMGKQLVAHFGDIFTVEDLTHRVQMEAQPEKLETLTINNKSYEAEYFGRKPLSISVYEYSYVEYWRLVDGYDAFSNAGFTGHIMGANGFPMLIEEGGTYIVQHIYPDGRKVRAYYLCDGSVLEDSLIAKEVYSSKIK